MKIVYSDKHAQHDPQHFVVRGTKQRSAEQPERATRLLAAMKRHGERLSNMNLEVSLIPTSEQKQSSFPSTASCRWQQLLCFGEA